jgi:hypothetical protein
VIHPAKANDILWSRNELLSASQSDCAAMGLMHRNFTHNKCDATCTQCAGAMLPRDKFPAIGRNSAIGSPTTSASSHPRIFGPRRTAYNDVVTGFERYRRYRLIDYEAAKAWNTTQRSCLADLGHGLSGQVRRGQRPYSVAARWFAWREHVCTENTQWFLGTGPSYQGQTSRISDLLSKPGEHQLGSR